MDAMTALTGAREITIDSADESKWSCGVAGLEYVAKRPALTASQMHMRKAPIKRVGRRPRRSIQRRAGTVMMTLMTNWMPLGKQDSVSTCAVSEVVKERLFHSAKLIGVGKASHGKQICNMVHLK